MENKTKNVCCRCGAEIKDNETYECDSDQYCEECFDDTFIRCSHCNQLLIKDTSWQNSNEDYVCPDCKDTYYRQCYNCDAWIHKDDAYYSEVADESYCQSCYSETHTTCYRCNCTILSVDAIEHDGDYYCLDCCEIIEAKNDIIHDYSYKPRPIFYKTKKETNDARFFGVELEIENPSDNDDHIEALGQIGNFIYYKHDGSLSNGFEVVTHPFTWKWWCEHNSILDPIFDLKDEEYRSYDTHTCGMHVHVTKDSISSLTLYRLLRLFVGYPDWVKRIARRRDKEFNSWCAIEFDHRLTTIAKNKNDSDNRHKAINLCPDNTIEFRIFRGTLNKNSFMANLDFVYTVIQYCEQTSYRDVCPSGYYQFLGKRETKQLETAMSCVSDNEDE